MNKPSKTLKIEWRHSKANAPRIDKTLKELRVQLKMKNIDVIYIEKKIAAPGYSEILFNDMPMEFLMDEARVKESFCGTCLTPAERKKKFEIFSAALIKKAALKAAGVKA